MVQYISIIVIAMAMVHTAVPQYTDDPDFDPHKQISERICFHLEDIAMKAEIQYGDCTWLKEALKAGLGSILYPGNNDDPGDHHDDPEHDYRPPPVESDEEMDRRNCYELEKVRNNYFNDQMNTAAIPPDVAVFGLTLSCDELRQMKDNVVKSIAGRLFVKKS